MESLYEKLTIYKKSLDLTKHIELLVSNFNRHHKYAIGTELRSLSIRILVLIAKANGKKFRIANLEEAISLLEELKIVLRLCKEIGCFKSFKSFEYVSKSVIELLRQCEGWKSQSSKAITA